MAGEGKRETMESVAREEDWKPRSGRCGNEKEVKSRVRKCPKGAGAGSGVTTRRRNAAAFG